MKIGIITILDNKNYGNRLQNYALQTILEGMGHSVETVKNNVYYNTKRSPVRILIWRFWRILCGKNVPCKVNKQRYSHFENFNLNIRFNKITYLGNCRYDRYDYYITGSDQVWNPNGRLTAIDLLAFAKPEKRVAFSASFGVSELPEGKKEEARIELSKFKAISVREDAGKRIVEELTGRKDVQVLLDPTMFLSAQEWNRVAKQPEMLKTESPYLLMCFLGGIAEQRKEEVQIFSQRHGWIIVDIADEKSPYYECGPSEFLYLEKNAALICTDSFHASVFAIIYNRPFVVYYREGDSEQSMHSRVQTLLDKFGLKDRAYSGKLTEEQLIYSYEGVCAQLDKEKERAFDFLRRALK